MDIYYSRMKNLQEQNQSAQEQQIEETTSVHSCNEKPENLPTLKKCTTCTRGPQGPEFFIGVKGQVVKRCLKCRDKGAKRDAREDIIEKKKALQHKKQYWKDYRVKKRAEDLKGFLKHLAEIHRNWRNRNKEHSNAWGKLNFASIKLEDSL